MDPVLLGEILAVAMFVLMVPAALLGYPVGLTLAGLAVLTGSLGAVLGVFSWPLMGAIYSRVYGLMSDELLVALPLFIMMGVILDRARIAEDLLETAGQLFGPVRGGLGVATLAVGALLAASTGLVSATAITMAMISIPAMRRAGYGEALAGGTVCASATLSQIIPPSTVLILLAIQLQNANASAQAKLGNLFSEPVTVTDMFAAALLPGLLLVAVFIAFVLLVGLVRPDLCPRVPPAVGGGRALARRTLGALLPPLALIVAVLGSILAGIATPTESASVGAVGALIIALVQGRLSLALVRETARETMAITAMAFMILIGAAFFMLVFRGLGGERLVLDLIDSVPGELSGAVLFVLGLMFVLGFFLDAFEIILIVAPTFAPALIILGADPIWLGVMMAMVLQTSYLTPPFGLAMFFVQGSSDGLPLRTLYRGVMPFIALQLVTMAILWAVPDIVHVLRFGR